ncbi:hypothetical protein L202_04988 [Cryptococcus amylolentus CBS 6039]|uniref:C2H2-type domain-containing protein n=1 Tax=Cryptococcus amylolentus CBS 6039 TaxID=1295533 RepID=A0A1E3HNG8_9TREE|nr:hypothetical protein L202_04988 [Cryptococcus amylolentus CBS 6039]ODN77874.1 hypothetical protein L202_04988 [Cryptococcus amylolentus CBS 6039]
MERASAASHSHRRFRPYPAHDHHHHPDVSSSSPPSPLKRSPPTKSKSYEPTRPSALYQPSKGARRDAKYSQRMHLHPQQRKSSNNDGLAPAAVSSRRSYDAAAAASRRRMPGPLMTIEPLTGASMRARYPSSISPEEQERLRAEQSAAIMRVRQMRAHQDMEKRRRKEDLRETDQKKTRMIQLQVFVHARPTRCAWSDCEAELNSWALLEKHVHHAHLKHSLHKVGDVQCQWYQCDNTFRTQEECYRHVLVVHMRHFSARCPLFQCDFVGENFSHLVDHIESVHPSATPDDFIPGLIHFRPSSASLSKAFADVPTLPEHAPLPDIISMTAESYTGGIGNRTKRKVASRCCSEKCPKMLPGQSAEAKKGKATRIMTLVVERARRRRLSDDSSDTRLEVDPVSRPEEDIKLQEDGNDAQGNKSEILEHEGAPIGIEEALKSASEFPQTRPLIVSAHSDGDTVSTSPSSTASSCPPMLERELKIVGSR